MPAPRDGRDGTGPDGVVLRQAALRWLDDDLPRLTPRDRAASYARMFPDYPPLAATDRWLYGIWGFGNNYKGSGFYGSYPPSYLRRVDALFPDRTPDWRVLHAFSGSLKADSPIPGLRVDLVASRQPDVQADVLRLPLGDGCIDLTLADTPYGPVHAKRYGTPMPSRKAVLTELARVTRPGGHLVWLDTVRPMFRKLYWHEWGTIGCVGSTNHVVRGVFVYQRTADAP